MKTFLYSIPNTIQSFSKKLDVKSVLCGKSWDIFNDEGVKQLFIFNKDETIHISNNGKVINASWKYIPQNSSILITIDEETIMFRPAFFDKDVIVLQRDGTELYLFMIDEQRKASSALFTLDAIIEYIKKEIAWASMSAEEQNKLRELERMRVIEERKRLREIERQREEEEIKRKQAIEEQQKEEERKRQEEQVQRNKQAERSLIIEYIKGHREEISSKLLRRKKIGRIGAISNAVLLLLSLLFSSLDLIRIPVILPLVAIITIAFIGYSMSSYADIIRPHIHNGILYHTELEVRKMYEEL